LCSRGQAAAYWEGYSGALRPAERPAEEVARAAECACLRLASAPAQGLGLPWAAGGGSLRAKAEALFKARALPLLAFVPPATLASVLDDTFGVGGKAAKLDDPELFAMRFLGTGLEVAPRP